MDSERTQAIVDEAERKGIEDVGDSGGEGEGEGRGAGGRKVSRAGGRWRRVEVR